MEIELNILICFKISAFMLLKEVTKIMCVFACDEMKNIHKLYVIVHNIKTYGDA